MGCDIHMFVEYADKRRLKEQRDENKPEGWNCFGGRINPGRNYTMFGILCRGVRSNFDLGFPKKERLDIDKMSYDAKSLMFHYISESNDIEYSSVNIETALRYQKYGSKLYKDSSGEYAWVDNPDWHSHSWLSLDEFETALDLYKKIDDDYLGIESNIPLEWKAVLSVMKVLEDDGNNEVRVVFWFDN